MHMACRSVVPCLAVLTVITVIFNSACWCMQVITSGLKEETVSVGECDECLTPAEQLLPRRQPQPKPGEPQVQAAPWTSHTLLP